MSTTNQWMSFMEIEQTVAQRMANAIETIAIYETNTRMAHDLINKCSNCKRIGHLTKDYRALIPASTPRPPVAKHMTKVTCYECRRMGHYKSDFPKWKNRNQVIKQRKGKACGDSSDDV
ncbi:reverse transcriptase domain-containing protein [Tanacetum coccineum]